MSKSSLIIAPFALALSLGLAPAILGQAGPPRVERRAGGEPSYSVFYERLATDGDWRESAEYGYVFHPRVNTGWRPYTQGHWARTDAGWTWISTERFGWATYHYGRWAKLRSVGWVWVPGEQWAPSWVSWRSNDKYVGWAPLPPEARFERSSGINAAVDVEYDIGPTSYTFVQVERFSSPSIREVIVREDENIVIVEQTRNVTNIRYGDGSVVFVEGPRYEVVSQRVSTPFAQLRLERRTELSGSFETQISGGTVVALAPQFVRSESARPAQLGVRIERVEVERGWSDVKDQGAVERLRAKVKSESPETQKATVVVKPQAAGAATPATSSASPAPGGATPAPAAATAAPGAAPAASPAVTAAPKNGTPAPTPPAASPAKPAPTPVTKATPPKEMPKETPAPSKAPPAAASPAPTPVTKATPPKEMPKETPAKAPATPAKPAATVAPKEAPAPTKAPDAPARKEPTANAAAEKARAERANAEKAKQAADERRASAVKAEPKAEPKPREMAPPPPREAKPAAPPPQKPADMREPKAPVPREANAPAAPPAKSAKPDESKKKGEAEPTPTPPR